MTSKSTVPTVKEEEMKEASPDQEVPSLLIADLRKNANLLEKSVTTKEARLTSRVIRGLVTVRRKLSAEVLAQFISENFSLDEDSKRKRELLLYLNQDPNKFLNLSESEQPKKTKSLLPEVEIYTHLLVTIFLIDHKQYEQACQCSATLVERLEDLNRSTLNPLSAKAYFYYARAWELANKLENIRANLHKFYRTSTLRHNDEGSATLLNALLRNYLTYNLYDQADKLVAKVTFREDATSSNQYARYLFYLGKIKSIQLEYTEAYKCLLGAIRKAPQSSARGFRIAVHKLLCIVELLMGEIPERSMFRQPDLKKALLPYLQLTQAVRFGDLNTFHNVVSGFSALFQRDGTYSLIQRLHHNVIKTGLRKINLSYTRISFTDICTKLHLGSPDDAEFIVAKAIRDGVINATIHHEGKYIQSKEKFDVYSTNEPLGTFHKRIKFCLKTHNDAVKAMRFPPDAHKNSAVESAKERREREAEIQKAMEDDDEEPF